MKKIVLITTALEKTWFEDGYFVFLGEWCKKYSERDRLNAIEHETVPFHWEDRDKFEKDAVYLEHLHEKLLPCFQVFLNNYHRKNYSLKYWRVIIGPWLSVIVPTIYDRWENISAAMRCHDYHAISLNQNIDSDLICPDYLSFSSSVHKDEWNYFLYSDLIKKRYGEDAYKATSNIRPKSRKNINTIENSWSSKVINLLDTFISKIQPKYKVAFINSYLNPLARIKISFKLGQFPRLHSIFKQEIPITNLVDQIRNSDIQYEANNDFESYINKNILRFLPASYLEQFTLVQNIANNILDDMRLVVTANDHFSNDLFKIWCANRMENDESKLLVSSHGGALPSKYSSFQAHEEKIADTRIVWHKALTKKQVQLPANKYVGNNLKLSKREDKVTMLGSDFGRYTFGAQSGTNSSLMLFDYEQKKEFLRYSKDKFHREIEYYPYPSVSWELDSRFSDTFGNDNKSSYSSFDEVLSKSKLVICTYPQTTYSDSLFANAPTVLLYLDKYWTFPEYFDSIITDLKRVNMLFNDPIQAANHVNKIWNDPEAWWETKEVQDVRKAFHSECVYVSGNGVPEWQNFLLDYE